MNRETIEEVLSTFLCFVISLLSDPRAPVPSDDVSSLHFPPTVRCSKKEKRSLSSCWRQRECRLCASEESWIDLFRSWLEQLGRAVCAKVKTILGWLIPFPYGRQSHQAAIFSPSEQLMWCAVRWWDLFTSILRSVSAVESEREAMKRKTKWIFLKKMKIAFFRVENRFIKTSKLRPSQILIITLLSFASASSSSTCLQFCQNNNFGLDFCVCLSHIGYFSYTHPNVGVEFIWAWKLKVVCLRFRPHQSRTRTRRHRRLSHMWGGSHSKKKKAA